MPGCRSVISPSSTRLMAWPPCVCQEVQAPGEKSTTSCTSSACWTAFVTSNRDSAMIVRSPPAAGLLPTRASPRPAAMSARIGTRGLVPKWPVGLARSPCRHDRRASAFELGKLAAPRHLHLELAAAAADDWTVGIRRIERVGKPAAPRAAAAARCDIAAAPAGRRHAADLGKRLGIGDLGAALEQ